MIATFTALLLAHVCADFLFQPDTMAAAKQRRAPSALALHGLIVLATASLATLPSGAEAMIPLLALTAAHLAIDLVKTAFPASHVGPFLADQAAHALSLAAVAYAWPGLFHDGYLGPHSAVLPVMAVLAGFIVATRAGGYAIGLLVRPFGRAFRAEGLPRGGQLIGVLERGLIFFFVLVGQPSAVGFLIAAKSVLRFDTGKRRQKAAEYVIIGTLASFGWALLSAYGTLALLNRFPPLGILPAID